MVVHLCQGCISLFTFIGVDTVPQILSDQPENTSFYISKLSSWFEMFQSVIEGEILVEKPSGLLVVSSKIFTFEFYFGFPCGSQLFCSLCFDVLFIFVVYHFS